MANSAEFSLGAMLPDFASMVGARSIEADNPHILRGIEFHHATDRAFHRAQPFVDFERQGRSDLQQLGVRRGPSRAAAHVGVELMFDVELFCNRELAQSKSVRESWFDNYVTALRTATSSKSVPRLGFIARRRADADIGAATAFDALIRRLLASNPRLWERSPERIAMRIEQTLVRRPKLALQGEERASISRWVQALWPALSEQTPSWLGQIQGKLDTFYGWEGNRSMISGQTTTSAPASEPNG